MVRKSGVIFFHICFLLGLILGNITLASGEYFWPIIFQIIFMTIAITGCIYTIKGNSLFIQAYYSLIIIIAIFFLINGLERFQFTKEYQSYF